MRMRMRMRMSIRYSMIAAFGKTFLFVSPFIVFIGKGFVPKNRVTSPTLGISNGLKNSLFDIFHW